jgi:hypothetical protein
LKADQVAAVNVLPSALTAGEPASTGEELCPPLNNTTSPLALPSEAATYTPAIGVFVQGETLVMSNVPGFFVPCEQLPAPSLGAEAGRS